MAWFNPATWTPVDAVQNKLSQFGTAANSFQGAGGNKVMFSNPNGITTSRPQASPIAQPRNDQEPQPIPTGAYLGGSNGGSSSGGNAGYDPAALASFDTSINSANNSLGLLDRQQDIGQENINNGFNSSLNRLLGGKATADRNYNTTKTQSTQDNITARNNIKTSVGRNANAVQRLLGQRGAGNSSAAQIVAPYGAALQGTQQLKGVTDAFGRNMQSLDTNYQDFNRDWSNSREDLDRQKFTQEQSLRSSVAERRANLLNSLGQLQSQRVAAQGGNSAAALAAAQPSIDQANRLQGDIVDYGRQFANAINVNTPTYTSPDLAQYNYEAGQGPSVENNSAYTDTINPFLSSLLGNRKQRIGQ